MTGISTFFATRPRNLTGIGSLSLFGKSPSAECADSPKPGHWSLSSLHGSSFFREHGLLAEPFLVVALIAVVRRILVITAELPKLPQAGVEVFRQAILELGLLTVMVVALVGSLIALQKGAKRGRVE
jgi:hypothetical protein